MYTLYKLTDNDLDTLGVKGNAKHYIGVSDRVDDLVSYHYVDNAVEKWKMYNSNRRFPFYNFRGLVVDTKTKNIIMKSFPKTPNIILNGDYRILRDDIKYGRKYDGTVIRVRYWDDKWRVSTHKKIDCSNSRYGSEMTFGEMFEEACKKYDFKIETLEKDKCYVFILVHPENQFIKTNVSEPELYHIDTLITSKKKMFGLTNMKSIYLKSDIKIPKPEMLSKAQAIELLENGIGVVTYDPENKINYIPSSLQHKIEIRGNQPNLFLRWCELRDLNMEKELINVVPEKQASIVSSFEEKLREQIKLTIPIIIDCINGKKSLDTTQRLQATSGYQPPHYSLAMLFAPFKYPQDKLEQIIEEHILQLQPKDLYRFVVSCTNKHIKSQEKWSSLTA